MKWALESSLPPTHTLAGLRLLYPASPFDQVLKQLADVLFCRVVGQVPFRVETFRGIADHHLRLVDREHVQENDIWRR